MTAKLRVQYGTLQVEFEGSEDFIKSDLVSLLKKLSELPKTQIESSKTPAAKFSGANGTGVEELSTSTIARKLAAASGPDLIMAAAAYLTLGKKKESFTRKDLIEEMKVAKAYNKASYLSNLGQYLASLTKAGNLNQLAGEDYSLPAGKRSEIEAKLVS